MALRIKPNDPKGAEKYFSDKMAYTTGPVELNHLLESEANINVVDVRAEEDFKEAHIPGAINLPEDDWATLKGLKEDQNNILCCYSQTCHLAAMAGKYFASKGFPVVELDGGFEGWKEHDLETVSEVSDSGARPQRSEASQAPLE